MAFAFADGTGEIDDPYIIETPEQMNNVRNDLSAHYKLGNDIDLSAYGTGTGWTPIGTSSNQFWGSFDGDGYKITGLFINNSSTSNIGLFGFVIGSVSNLGIEGANVTGNSNVGGIAGTVQATTSGGIDYPGAITNCYVTGKISGSTQYVGGIAGHVTGARTKVTECHSSATVAATGTAIGTGTSAGGIVGRVTWGEISNCYSTGEISAQNYAGGIVGQINGGTFSDNAALNSKITTTATSGTIAAGRIIGGAMVAADNITGNVAFDGMTVNGSTISSGTGSDFNGESIS
ncbi:MAG: hypothetical protein FWH22_02670, partial [Fibromonadales bacterium]|nr:hypothetical protein [Fibromonadales bacterium]